MFGTRPAFFRRGIRSTVLKWFPLILESEDKPERDSEDSSEGLSDEARQRIKKAVREFLEKLKKQRHTNGSESPEADS